MYSILMVTIAWLMLEHAEVASGSLEDASDADVDFYKGKIASARFFVAEALPKIAARTEAAQAEDGWLMNLPDEAF
jgi:hypothetical protein